MLSNLLFGESLSIHFTYVCTWNNIPENDNLNQKKISPRANFYFSAKQNLFGCAHGHQPTTI